MFARLKLIPLFSLLLLTLGCHAPLTRDGLPSVPRSEFLKPAFDGRTWVLMNRRANPHSSLTEYLPIDQSPLTWTESYGGTFHAEGSHSGSLQSEYDDFIQSLRKTCPEIQPRLISSGETDLYYEWQIKNCHEHPDQIELGRFVRSTEGIYRLAYVRKTDAIAEAQRDKWLALLRQAQLQKAR